MLGGACLGGTGGEFQGRLEFEVVSAVGLHVAEDRNHGCTGHRGESDPGGRELEAAAQETRQLACADRSSERRRRQ